MVNNSLSKTLFIGGSQVEAITILQDGNVGINSIIPARTLDVVGSISKTIWKLLKHYRAYVTETM